MDQKLYKCNGNRKIFSPIPSFPTVFLISNQEAGVAGIDLCAGFKQSVSREIKKSVIDSEPTKFNPQRLL